MEKQIILSIYNSERGVSAVLIAILLSVFMGFAALALDLSHLFVAQNELKNAADAGALAGARFLYNDEGTSVNTGSNKIGHDAAVANQSERVPVEVNWDGNNMTADVRRGHWSFGLGDQPQGFQPNDNTDPPVLWERTTKELDEDLRFINAVEVTTNRTREGTPIASFFAQLFGYEYFQRHVTSVAYIGYAGTVELEDLEVPIAICKQSITDEDGRFTCNTGRMINSSGSTTTNTGAWSNLEQVDGSCEEATDNPPTATPPTVRPLVCGNLGPISLNGGDGMGTIGGMTNNVYDDFRDCWLAHTGEDGITPDLGQENDPTGRDYPTKAWEMTLPVIDCPGSNPGPCSDFVTIVTLQVVWVKQSSTDPHWNDIPVKMEHLETGSTWECTAWTSGMADIDDLTEEQRHQCWQEFATEFGLVTWDDNSVGDLSSSDLQKTIFFKPVCAVQAPQGGPSDVNTGILARIPVLVK